MKPREKYVSVDDLIISLNSKLGEYFISNMNHTNLSAVSDSTVTLVPDIGSLYKTYSYFINILNGLENIQYKENVNIKDGKLTLEYIIHDSVHHFNIQATVDVKDGNTYLANKMNAFRIILNNISGEYINFLFRSFMTSMNNKYPQYKNKCFDFTRDLLKDKELRDEVNKQFKLLVKDKDLVY